MQVCIFSENELLISGLPLRRENLLKEASRGRVQDNYVLEVNLIVSISLSKEFVMVQEIKSGHILLLLLIGGVKKDDLPSSFSVSDEAQSILELFSDGFTLS